MSQHILKDSVSYLSRSSMVSGKSRFVYIRATCWILVKNYLMNIESLLIFSFVNNIRTYKIVILTVEFPLQIKSSVKQ
jgi:hypothetical protein